MYDIYKIRCQKWKNVKKRSELANIQPIVVFKNKLLDGAYFLFFWPAKRRERERVCVCGSKVFCIEEKKSEGNKNETTKELRKKYEGKIVKFGRVQKDNRKSSASRGETKEEKRLSRRV